MDFDSFLHLYQSVYFNLPRPIKTFLGGIYGKIPLNVRFGKGYDIHKKIVEKFEESDEQYQLDFIYNKTYETLQFAQEHIPYYQKLFNEYSFQVKDFKSLSDINKLPRLTKEIIQKELNNLHTTKFDKAVAYYTGGSSSTPMKILAPMQTSRAKEKAYNNYIFSKAGYKYRDNMVALKGRDSSDAKKDIYWEYQLIDNQMLVSGVYLEKEYIEKIVEEIKRYKPKYFYGYPSAVEAFIKACKLKNINSLDGIYGVFLISESVFPEHIDMMKEFFNCPIVSHYGHTERVSISYRIDHEPYNFLNSYGLTRIINDEMVVTSFDNFVMPYINYSTKDFVNGELDLYKDSDVVKRAGTIEGRIQEYVVADDGSTMSILSIGAGHYSSYDGVDVAQFYQDKPGFVTLFVQSSDPKKVQVEKMIEQMEVQVRNRIKFNVVFKEKIEKTSRGKRRLCIQKLDIEKYKLADKKIE